jgi:hypothetical protein
MERLAPEPHTRLRYFCSPQHIDSALYPIIGQMERAAGFAHGDRNPCKTRQAGRPPRAELYAPRRRGTTGGDALTSERRTLFQPRIRPAAAPPADTELIGTPFNSHAAQQLKLQSALITPLIHVKAYAAPETKVAAERTRLLIEQAEAEGETPEDPLMWFSALYGFAAVNFVGFNGDVLRKMAEQFSIRAERQGAPVPIMIGHRRRVSGATMAKCSKRANCWLWCMGGSRKGLARAI